MQISIRPSLIESVKKDDKIIAYRIMCSEPHEWFLTRNVNLVRILKNARWAVKVQLEEREIKDEFGKIGIQKWIQ
mgnify:FL=1